MWKNKVAQFAKTPLFRWGMRLMIQLAVPRTRVGVAVVAVNEEAEVFMVRHVFHPVFEWGLPGGWLKKNEPPAAGALRELKEETGLTAVLGPAVSVVHETDSAHIGIAYAARLNPGAIQLSHELIEARWFDHQALPQPISYHTKLAIEAAVVHQKNLGIGELSTA